MNPVEDMQTDILTSVKRKSSFFIPLLFYNRMQNTFDVTLGTTSLVQPYGWILTDALLAECNSSTCFELRIGENVTAPDSALILNIKVIQNKTSVLLAYNDVYIVYPFFNG